MAKNTTDDVEFCTKPFFDLKPFFMNAINFDERKETKRKYRREYGNRMLEVWVPCSW